jgi:ATP-dependent DNA helicase RecG
LKQPILADLFSRVLLMERRGSGLRKMVAETENLFGYRQQFKPIFHSTRDEFRVTFWNLNYISHDTDQVAQKMKELLLFCSSPKSRQEMMDHFGLSHIRTFRETYLNPLLEVGKLRRTIPDKPRSSKQKYVIVK